MNAFYSSSDKNEKDFERTVKAKRNNKYIPHAYRKQSPLEEKRTLRSEKGVPLLPFAKICLNIKVQDDVLSSG